MDYTPSEFPTSFDPSSLKDKSILITGGASGLGAAFARGFAKAGAFVTIADINRDGGVALEEELTKANFGAKFVLCDVTSWKSQTEAFKTAISSSPTKTLDTVVAAAGIAGGIMNLNPKSDPTDDEDPPEPSTKCLQVNLFGVYYTTQLSLYYMGQILPKTEATTETTTIPRTNPKSIILVGSLAGYHGVPTAVEYTAGKYGVRGILKSMRADTPAAGVRLNIIAPTYIDTPLMSRKMVQSLKDGGVQFADIQTAVEAVLVLASNQNIHGRSICVGASGNFDLRDDSEGLNAGLMLKSYAEEVNALREKAGLKGSERLSERVSWGFMI